MNEARTHTGLEAIRVMFARAEKEDRPAFLPYFPVGYPDIETSLSVIEALSEAGADGFEIGVPFSDPLADGPTIQEATQQALARGVTVQTCLEAVQILRRRRVTQPMLLMSYLNPLLAYGLESLVLAARTAGVSGLIVPDLPPEEGETLIQLCAREGLGMVFFLAPTSSPERIALATKHARGFIYVVSLIGITGARDTLPENLLSFLQQVRASTAQPLVLGFGISQPDHVHMIRSHVNGFIVGSALVRKARESVEAVRKLAKSLRDASEAVD